MPSLTWYKERLSIMPLEEIPFRIIQQVQNIAGRIRRWPKAEDVSLKSVCGGPLSAVAFREAKRPFPCNSAVPEGFQDHATLLEDAEQLLAHRFSFHSFVNEDLGKVLKWNREYSKGIDIPLRYGPSIDFRDPEKVGDVKYAWSLGGVMRHLPRLAQAYKVTGDERYAREVVEQITSWIEQCPNRMGIQWASPTIAAKRLIGWVLALEWIKFSPECTDDFLNLVVRSVDQHLEFVVSNMLKHGSVNNHFLAELTGIYLAASYWKEIKKASKWKRMAKKMLVEQCQRQNAPDGVNYEQSLNYQYFVWDMLLLPALCAESEGRPFPAVYLKRLEKMAEYMAWTADCHHNIPNVGDEDCEMACWIGDKEAPRPISLLNTAALLWDKPEYKHWAGAILDEKTAWRLPEALGRRYRDLDCGNSLPIRSNRLFPQGGYLVLRHGRSSADEAMVLFDHGPMGFEKASAHGHSDMLAVCLHLGGEPFLIDPGTFSYQETEWRPYFRSALVHNTLSFGNENHSKYINRFIWGQKGHAQLDSFQDTGLYTVARASARWWTDEFHQRELKWHPKAETLTIFDTWDAEKTPEIHFTLSPDLRVKFEDGMCRVEGKRAILSFENNECEMDLEPMQVSPTCYRLADSQRLVIRPNKNVRSTLTTLKWEFFE